MLRSAISWIAAIAVLGYAGYAVTSLFTLFTAPTCPAKARCLKSLLHVTPHDLAVFGPAREGVQPPSSPLFEIKKFNPQEPFSKTLTLKIPSAVRNNNSMNLYVTMMPSRIRSVNWDESRTQGSVERIPLIAYTVPRAETFNLLEEKAPDRHNTNKKDNVRPVAHVKSFVSFSVLADSIDLPVNNLPPELVNYIKIDNHDRYYPIIQYNFLKSRINDLIQVKKDTFELNVTLDYVPASIGKMKFLVHISLAMKSMMSMGFTNKDVDEVKSIFADSNLYILSLTVIISSFHLLFDFLAFKNDVYFWRGKKSMAGLSMRTVLWRAFSQIIITLYLMDANTSLLVLIPSAISAVIELWKAKKVLRITFSWEKTLPRISIEDNTSNKAEMRTREVDREAMKYLSYILYPICIIGAIYSLLYQPHKSWYSWTLHSTVNGVYAFGFLFMLPQLFINYKLKSVAALPWRAFTYKAFNTFIDDVFAFIITMPTAHRVACFRDDVVFLVYLYQRWLYPVDKSRVDDSYSMEETVDESHEKKE